MVTAYFDESDTSKTSVVAGVVSVVDRWVSFETDWRKLLKSFGITCLHMKDYVHSKNEFESWQNDEEKRKRFLNRVVEIISRRCMLSVGIALDNRSFADIFTADPVVSQLFPSQYMTAGLMCILRIGEWAKRCNFNEPINYVFDIGNKNRRILEVTYDSLRHIPELRDDCRLGAISFADDKLLSPLQAADFVAYEVSKVCTDLSSGHDRLRGSLKSMMARVNGDWKVASRRDLIRFAEKVRQTVPG